MTEAQAIEAVLQHWKDEWEFLRPTVPWTTENEVFDAAAAWVRIAMVPMDARQASLGAVIRWANVGRIAVQIFTAPNIGALYARQLADDVRSVLRGRRIPGPDVDAEPVCTYAAASSGPTNDGAWNMLLVTVPYRYDEHAVDPPPAPVASFTSSENFLEVTFTDTSTGDGISWEWDFGDDETSTDQSPVHTYAEAGTYTVTLVVTDSRGRTDEHDEEIEVEDEP